MRTILALGVLATWGLGMLAAQDASAYVPLHHWAMPYVEHLIARGAMVDPAPLTRPLKKADLIRALRAVDSLQVPAPEWRMARRILRDLERREQGPWGRVDAHVSASAATHPLRDALETRCRPTDAGCAARDPERTRGFLAGGVAVELAFGPVVAVTHPYFDTRLKSDPDYLGKKDRVVAGRNAEAYLSAQGRFGELFFGSLDRNWGPSAVEGLVLSPAPYSYDHFALSVGTTGIRIEGVITQLDDLADTAGAVHQRYFVAHRVVVRPPGSTTVALWEGTIVAGPDRELEPWYANVLTLGLLANYDQGGASNNLVGLDVETRVGGATAFGSLLIDDIQVDRSDTSDAEPTSYGLTLGARRAIGPASVTAFYTRVSNLAYRTPQVTETVMRRGVGLARNYADYDQLTLRAGLLAGPGVLLSPEVTLVRQGEGDFRRAFPPVSAYDTTTTFLAGTVERTLRLALGARVDWGALGVAAEGGAHIVSNADHVRGEDETRFVGRVGVTWRWKKESVLP